jgi:hypothetical protein
MVLQTIRKLSTFGWIIKALAVFSASSSFAQNLQLDSELGRNATQGCAISVSAPAPNSSRSANARIVLPPVEGAYLGAYQIPAQPRETERFQQAIGQVPPIVFSFHDFFADSNSGTSPDLLFSSKMEGEGSLSPLAMAEYLRQRGSVLALAWAVYCCDINKTTFWLRLKRPHDHFNRLLAGQHDDFIRQTARQIRDWGGPIMLTVVPEMNWQGQFLFGQDGRKWMDSVDNICSEYGDPAWPDGPERIRDLFIHVIDIFREEGAHNVTWFMYSGNQYMAQGVEGQSRWLHPQYYYPGDAYIDWVGQSVYFTDPSWNHGFEDTGSFQEVFLPGYNAWQSVTSKPMMLPEFGLLARSSDDRRALWSDVLTRYLKSTPNVRAITIADSQLFALYFNIPALSANLADTNTVREIRAQDGYYRPELRVKNGG